MQAHIGVDQHQQLFVGRGRVVPRVGSHTTITGPALAGPARRQRRGGHELDPVGRCGDRRGVVLAGVVDDDHPDVVAGGLAPQIRQQPPQARALVARRDDHRRRAPGSAASCDERIPAAQGRRTTQRPPTGQPSCDAHPVRHRHLFSSTLTLLDPSATGRVRMQVHPGTSVTPLARHPRSPCSGSLGARELGCCTTAASRRCRTPAREVLTLRFTDEHHLFRTTVRELVQREIDAHADAVGARRRLPGTRALHEVRRPRSARHRVRPGLRRRWCRPLLHDDLRRGDRPRRPRSASPWRSRCRPTWPRLRCTASAARS